MWEAFRKGGWGSVNKDGAVGGEAKQDGSGRCTRENWVLLENVYPPLHKTSINESASDSEGTQRFSVAALQANARHRCLRSPFSRPFHCFLPVFELLATFLTPFQVRTLNWYLSLLQSLEPEERSGEEPSVPALLRHQHTPGKAGHHRHKLMAGLPKSPAGPSSGSQGPGTP